MPVPYTSQLLLQGDAGTPSGMSNGTEAFEQIAATEKEHVEAESPLPISTDSGMHEHLHYFQLVTH